jgi:hypothetical protein
MPQLTRHTATALIIAAAMAAVWTCLRRVERSRSNRAASAWITVLVSIVASSVLGVVLLQRAEVPAETALDGRQWLYIPVDPEDPDGPSWAVSPDNPRFDELVAEGKGVLAPPRTQAE